MKISAVVPVYNGEDYVIDALSSLVKQKYALHEIIVINDFSQDQSCTIIEKFASECHVPIQILSNDRNRGVSYSRNRGVSTATGDAVLFVDADDILDENLTAFHLEKWKLADQNQRWVLSHSAYRQMVEDGNTLSDIFRFKQVDQEEIFGYEVVRNHVYLSGTIVNRRDFISVGGFDEKLTHCEDWDLWLRLAQIGGFLYIDTPLANIRRHQNNASRTVVSVNQGERQVLGKYDVLRLKDAIHRRKLPVEQNLMDQVFLLFRLNQWEKTEETIEYIVKQFSNFGGGFFLRGLLYVRKEDFLFAKKQFEKALEIDPQKGELLNNLGACHFLLGDIGLAENYIFKAISLVPNYLDAKWNLSVIRNAAGFPKFTWRELRPVLLMYN